jgi:hypothetical protein
VNNVSRARRYYLRWERYQRRCDVLGYGRDEWFMGRDYDARWDVRWKLKRHQMINKGVPSQELTR